VTHVSSLPRVTWRCAHKINFETSGAFAHRIAATRHGVAEPAPERGHHVTPCSSSAHAALPTQVVFEPQASTDVRAPARLHAMDDDDHSQRLLAAARHHELENLGVSRERFLQLLVFAAACLLTAVNWNILVR
jgi:hypothetical protein